MRPGAQVSDVWRKAACALLRLNKSECDAVALVFEEEATTDDVRMLVLDLLAGAGSFEAQIVMRRILALAIARRDSRTFAKYVQRLGFVDCPDGPTLRFLMSTYAEARTEVPDVRAACAFALGAAAGHSYTSGEPDAAVRATDVLRRDLVSASTSQEKCALLTALGNAGVSSDIMVVTRFTHDAEAPVRAAAALALRKMDVAEARAHLVGMLSDSELEVAERALLALADQKLDDDEIERLAELVLGARTSLALDARILEFLVSQRPKASACPGRAGAIENALRLLLGRVDTSAAEDRTGQWTRPPSAPPRGSGERRAVQPFRAAAPAAVAPSQSQQHAAPPVAPSASSDALADRATRALVRPQGIYAAPAPGRAMQQQPLPCSGSYRMVSVPASGPSSREQMIALGLDPDAHSVNIPPPPHVGRR